MHEWEKIWVNGYRTAEKKSTGFYSKCSGSKSYVSETNSDKYLLKKTEKWRQANRHKNKSLADILCKRHEVKATSQQN